MSINITQTVSKALTVNGTSAGYLTVADNTNLVLNAICFLGGTGLTTMTVKIVELGASGLVGVRQDSNTNYGRTDVSAYTVAAGSTITMIAPQVVEGAAAVDVGPGTDDYIDSNGSLVQIHEDTQILGSLTVTGALVGGLSLAAVGATPNANAASLAAGVLNLQPASATLPGVVTALAQSFGGAKTFASTIAASNYSGTSSGTNTGDVTIGTANGLSLVAQALSLAAAVAGGDNGALLGADKSKLDALSGANSGDVTLAAVAAVPNANGASLTGQALNLQPADGTFPGVVTALAQTIAGAKTFTGGVLSDSVQAATATFATIKGAVLTGATAVGVKITNLNTLSTAGAKICSWSPDNGTTELVYIDKDGNFFTFGNIKTSSGGGIFAPLFNPYAANSSLQLRGAITDGAGVIGVKVGNSAALANATAKIAAFYSDVFTTEKLAINVTGKLVWPTGGAADVIGTATLVAGTVTVATTAVAAASKIFVSCNTPGGVLGFLSAPVASIVAATSFVINSSNPADTSTVNWVIVG